MRLLTLIVFCFSFLLSYGQTNLYITQRDEAGNLNKIVFQKDSVVLSNNRLFIIYKEELTTNLFSEKKTEKHYLFTIMSETENGNLVSGLLDFDEAQSLVKFANSNFEKPANTIILFDSRYKHSVSLKYSLSGRFSFSLGGWSTNKENQCWLNKQEFLELASHLKKIITF